MTGSLRLPIGETIVLASASPRRADLLRAAGVRFEVRPADIDERPREREAPTEYVRRLAGEKAAAVDGGGAPVLAADTTVEIRGQMLEKPVDAADARRMLRLLSGATHHVHTGVTVTRDGRVESTVVTTAVTFVDLDDRAIEWYVESGEPMDKAGAYAIQGAAAAFVRRIDGSVTNVIGLPLAEALELLGAIG